MKLTLLLLLFTTIFIAGCNFQNEVGATITTTSTPILMSPSTPQSQTLFTSTPTPSVTSPSRTSTPTPNPPPTAMPTASPTTTPLPRPFEISVVLASVPYPLPFATKDGIAFFIQDGQFIISNIADPQNIQIIWESHLLDDGTQGLAVINNHAFLASTNQITVWNIDALSNPRVTATFPNSSGKAIVDVEENLLYLVTPTNGGQITTIDVSLPDSPSELGTLKLDGLEDRVRAWFPYLISPHLISQQRLFVANDNFIEIVDISDPTLAKPLAQLSAPTNLNAEMHLKDNLLFVGTHFGVYVFDLTDLDAPQQISQYFNSQINHMEIDGNTAYLFGEICGWETTDDGEVTGGCGYFIDVVDFSNPASPKSEGVVHLRLNTNQSSVESMTIQGELIYFKTADTLYVMDTSILK
ncbi:MAG: hypothetical protein H6667_08915 [Ardenticatenaceae bacterium]|nr:hypothetical protein [Ardenticatenaceae bacterium]